MFIISDKWVLRYYHPSVDPGVGIPDVQRVRDVVNILKHVSSCSCLVNTRSISIKHIGYTNPSGTHWVIDYNYNIHESDKPNRNCSYMYYSVITIIKALHYWKLIGIIDTIIVHYYYVLKIIKANRIGTVAKVIILY